MKKPDQLKNLNLQRLQPQNDPDVRNLSPNLAKPPIVIKYKSNEFANYITFGVVAFQCFVLFIMGYNFILNRRLAEFEKRITQSHALVIKDISVFNEVDILKRKIEVYKSVLERRVEMGRNTEGIFTSLTNETKLNELTLEGNKALLTVDTVEALPVALLIQRLLDSGPVHSVAISSASFNTEGDYRIQLEILFYSE